ncbi:Lin0512 family protein [Algicella marina]|uniref:Uncharacterized protein n=1 Tax=Algicella marina TaxID=2683284 RepID=A0A6P1SYE5_9RHOB|nr:Lin0512 family protein [Algicella marina]QHQ34019.1 hypothetical protein GO499_01870 [Algicella marina]
MPAKHLLVEFGLGTSLRRGDYTEAALRALRDALWHNSISLAEAFDVPKEAMLIKAEIGVQIPEAVDKSRLAEVFPYGNVSIDVVHGGLDVPKPDGSGVTIMANAAVSVSLSMEPA